ncbi:adiponectin receptor protein-like [Ornithodoros turicata]|uniref:adiponectin receptor protein-like n=1 Tax=Ornithodoros turicata TaxID=34597 RepID=UPI0031386CE8
MATAPCRLGRISENGERFIEFDLVKSGRNGAPDVHLKCRITATKRTRKLPSLQDADRQKKCETKSEKQPRSLFGSFLGNCLGDVFGTVQLMYQLLSCLSTKFAEVELLQEGEWLSGLPEEMPEHDSAKLKVLNWAEDTLNCRRVVPRIEVEDLEADDERDDDDEDESSGFFSDEVSVYSETDNEATCTVDRQVQCNLGKFTLAQAKDLNNVQCSPGLRSGKSKRGLLSHRELPAWLQNNDFLVRHHRPPLYSYKACLRSIFSIHSETGNIWTHLLGALGFALFSVYFFSAPVLNLDWTGSSMFFLYFVGAVTCLGLSATYHTLNCHSPDVCDLFCKMDYCGITILILGSIYPWLYFQFLCDPPKRLFYCILVTIMGGLTIRLSMSKKFGEPRYRVLRASVFFGFAMVCGILPTSHYGILYGWDNLMYDTKFVYVLLMMLMYVCGSCVYASRVPERFLPGAFDVIFNSHQVFHVFVILGALTHYVGIYQLASLRIAQGPCGPGRTDSVLEALGVV